MSNATFLRQHPEVGGSAWSAIVGVFTGVLAMALVPIALLLGPTAGGSDINAPDIAALVAVGAVLGVVVSWGGTWLWNEASSRISTTLAGLLIVVETISGYTYSYVLKQRLPPVIEVLGFALVVAGVVVVARLPVRSLMKEPGGNPAGPGSSCCPT
jgi:drug/metabolite transporter (DMT)-like permease